MMVVAMLIAVLSFVGCGDDPAETTAPNGTTQSSSSSSSEEATSSSSSSEEDTSSSSSSSEEATSSSSSSSESTEATTTESTTTLPPVFARFDFGTESKAIDLGMTTHEFLTKHLSYEEAYISVEYTEDAMVITALQDHPEIKLYIDEDGDRAEDFKHGAEEAFYSSLSYAVCFDDFDIYGFDDHLTKDQKFMKVRILNNTPNNVISFAFRDNNRGYSTTMNASCLYLQGGAPTVRDLVEGAKNSDYDQFRLTADPVDSYQSYVYDINLVMALTRYAQRGEAPAADSYVDYIYKLGAGITSTGANNWNWMGANEVSGLRFWFLGAYGVHSYRDYFDYADSRANIKKDAQVAVDYVTFADTKANLNLYTSKIEDVYISESNSIKESESISASISASISQSEADLTATTATTAAAA